MKSSLCSSRGFLSHHIYDTYRILGRWSRLKGQWGLRRGRTRMGSWRIRGVSQLERKRRGFSQHQDHYRQQTNVINMHHEPHAVLRASLPHSPTAPKSVHYHIYQMKKMRPKEVRSFTQIPQVPNDRIFGFKLNSSSKTCAPNCCSIRHHI